ncbi:MAG: ribonuclease HII [Chloroflexi bacterium]|nr:ribonuclease HII [Chloroflexota bacterium]
MKDSYKYIAGIDEVGRGTIAGPVVAAAVILRRDISYDELDDSKRLTEKNRKLLSKKIISQSIAWSISLSDVNEIDNLNILWATMLAMRRSILGLSCKPDFIQVDGNTLPNLEFYNEVLSAEAIIGGDAKIPAISAASIIAKVYRDNLMRSLGKIYPNFNFSKHKGYGTKDHIERLKEFGPCPQHRLSFRPLSSLLVK